MAIPQIVPMEGGAEPSGHSIKCSAADCIHNSGGSCSVDITVSAGPAPKCNTYEPGGKGGESAPPAPPVPMM